MTCRSRHRFRGKFHAAGQCPDDAWSHMHVVCRRCGFSWWQPTLFDLKATA